MTLRSPDTGLRTLQSQLWTSKLLRLQYAGAWTIDLGRDKSEISRWAAGSRGMSLDDWTCVATVCRREIAREGRDSVAWREALGAIRQLVLSALGDEDVTNAPVIGASPVAVAMESARTAGRDADAIEAALADGDLDPDDAAPLDEAAERHESLARRLRGMANEARQGGAGLPRRGVVEVARYDAPKAGGK